MAPPARRRDETILMRREGLVASALRPQYRIMPTTAERRALVFVAAIAVMGGIARVLRAREARPAPTEAAGRGPGPPGAARGGGGVGGGGEACRWYDFEGIVRVTVGRGCQKCRSRGPGRGGRRGDRAAPLGRSRAGGAHRRGP